MRPHLRALAQVRLAEIGVPILLCLLAASSSAPPLFAASVAAPGIAPFKPYRVLLVIGDQWKDPTSTLIADGAEFQDLVTLLKSWGVPFDILRLDQERLDTYHFLDMNGKPRYGAILWDADQAGPIQKQDYSLLARAVVDHHIGLIALAGRIKEPVIQGLLGVRYLAEHPHSSSLKIAAPHFLTRGLPDPLDPADAQSPLFKTRVQVEVSGAKVLANQGGFAQVTVREVHPDTPAIWIGGDAVRMFSYQPLRTLLRRAVTEAVGYSLGKTWRHHVILMMDDLGNAQNAWLEHWHYPALSAERIRRSLIEPLKKHNAVLVVNVLPGFVDDQARRVVPSWQQDFVDAFGVRQNYRSTKEGLDEGLKAGVIEIHSHGWTHMQPDLDSPPGPWWGSPVDGERSEVGWYREFYDTRRNAEIPAAVQAFHLERSRDWIKEQFGVEPLSFATGGNGVSTSFANNTWRIGARAGFGWYGGYLGEDFAVQGNANATAPFGGTDDVPLILPAPPDGHDRGIALDPEGFTPVFDKYPQARFMGLDEYIGYIHAKIRSVGRDNGSPLDDPMSISKGGRTAGRSVGIPSGGPSDKCAGGPAKSALDLEIVYHPRFGRYFETHPSQWDLQMSDWLLAQMKGSAWLIEVDGVAAPFAPAEMTTIRLAPGRPTHTVRFVRPASLR